MIFHFTVQTDRDIQSLLGQGNIYYNAYIRAAVPCHRKTSNIAYEINNDMFALPDLTYQCAHIG